MRLKSKSIKNKKDQLQYLLFHTSETLFTKLQILITMVHYSSRHTARIPGTEIYNFVLQSEVPCK